MRKVTPETRAAQRRIQLTSPQLISRSSQKRFDFRLVQNVHTTCSPFFGFRGQCRNSSKALAKLVLFRGTGSLSVEGPAEPCVSNVCAALIPTFEYVDTSSCTDFGRFFVAMSWLGLSSCFIPTGWRWIDGVSQHLRRYPYFRKPPNWFENYIAE